MYSSRIERMTEAVIRGVWYSGNINFDMTRAAGADITLALIR